MKLKNIITNLFKPGYFNIMFGKLIGRAKNFNKKKGKNWAKYNVEFTTEEFCKNIDEKLFQSVKDDVKALESKSNFLMQKLSAEPNQKLGGAANYLLLYFLVRKFKPSCVVETGVSAGWSSLAILQSLDKNNFGNLYSSDFPYFRLNNPEQYIGFLVKDEKLKKRWHLDISGDKFALPKISKMLGKKKINLFHYDSDKNYSGRDFAIQTLRHHFSQNTIIIFDDIDDNLHFKDFVINENYKYHILEKKKGKYVGIVGI
tara:strand:- start:119 stop:892 length:774 start_codon:yes stop_codon:yes gene_type:complete